MKSELAWCSCLASVAALVLFIVGTSTTYWIKDKTVAVLGNVPDHVGLLWDAHPKDTPDKIKVVQAFSILAIFASAAAVFSCGAPLMPKQKLIPHTKAWVMGSSLAAVAFGLIAVAVYADFNKNDGSNVEYDWSFVLMCVAVGLSAVPLVCSVPAKY